MKLYKVTLQGMHSNAAGTSPGISYVVAKDPNEAYETVKTYVDEEDLGFTYERELKSIELIAEAADFPDCRMHLHISTSRDGGRMSDG